MKSPVLAFIASVFFASSLVAQTPLVSVPVRHYHSPVTKIKVLAKTTTSYAVDYEDFIEYNFLTGTYDTFTRTYYSYDTLGRVNHDSVLAYHVNTKSFSDSVVNDHIFDAAGREIVILHHGISGGKLFVKGIDSTVYDKHGNVTANLTYDLSNGIWNLVYGVRNTYTYNSLNLMTQRIASQYDVSSGTWSPFSREDAIYDIANNPIARVDYRYASSNWNLQDTLVVTGYYNKSISPPRDTCFYVSYSSGTGKWERYLKRVFIYDSSRSKVISTRTWNNSNGNWVLGSKDTITYTKDGLQLFNADSNACGTSCFKAGYIERDSIFNDAAGNMFRYDEYTSAFTKAPVLKLFHRYLYYYKKIITELPGVTSDNQFTFYPNPVSDVLHIRNNNARSTSVSVSMYDMQGRLVRRSNYCNGAFIDIPVSELIKGVYSIKILDGNSILTKLVVKQ